MISVADRSSQVRDEILTEPSMDDQPAVAATATVAPPPSDHATSHIQQDSVGAPGVSESGVSVTPPEPTPKTSSVPCETIANISNASTDHQSAPQQSAQPHQHQSHILKNNNNCNKKKVVSSRRKPQVKKQNQHNSVANEQCPSQVVTTTETTTISEQTPADQDLLVKRFNSSHQPAKLIQDHQQIIAAAQEDQGRPHISHTLIQPFISK